MADVEPFRGWRYDLAQVGALAEVVAPPYDVIDAAEQTELYERHPCNVVRLILNRDEPGDENSDDKYERAAGFLKHWQSEGVLLQDKDPAFYVLHQEFDWDGVHYVRKGFLGRIRIEAFGEGQVYPHEMTMSGPKADRLKLVSACQANLSPIFGLFPDDDQAAQSPLEEAIRGVTPLEVTDALGVVNRLWPVSDPNVVSQVREALGDKPVFIADGHHRYETAVNYRNQLREEGVIVDDTHPANFVMMMFVGMSDPGLAILPTHRLVQGVPPVTEAQLRSALGSHVTFETIGTGDETWEHVEIDGEQTTFGFGTSDGAWLVGRVHDTSPMAELAADKSDAWRGLGVSILHRLLVDHLLGTAYPDAEPTTKYVHLMSQVTDALGSGDASLAILVNPATIEHVREIASGYETMPPKSTYFYPKLLSGITFHDLH